MVLSSSTENSLPLPMVTANQNESPPEPLPSTEKQLKVYTPKKDKSSTMAVDHSQSSNSQGNPTPSILPPSSPSNLPIALRKAKRTCTSHPMSHFVSYDSLSPSYRAYISSISSLPIPTKVADALADPNWKAAMIEEMSALEKQGTWDLVALPEGKHVVGCKWVYTLK